MPNTSLRPVNKNSLHFIPTKPAEDNSHARTCYNVSSSDDVRIAILYSENRVKKNYLWKRNVEVLNITPGGINYYHYLITDSVSLDQVPLTD